jgi:DNA processing protein
MQEKEICLLALTAINDIGPVTLKNVLDYFRDPVKPFGAKYEDLQKVKGISEKAAKEIIRMNPFKTASLMLREIDRGGMQLLTMYNDSYPPLLKEIYDPPPVLYLKGELTDDICLGVVGTRHPTPYGRLAAGEIGKNLAHEGINVVSGLARGIDTAAHKAALEAGGRTIAVLGCGLNKIYPRENKKLAKQIIERGALLSEFPPNTPPLSENFPRRNRIISGLSEVVVVVEAAEKSGALITANYALNQGRDVLAVPGNATSEKSVGTNNLIKEGAIPIVSFSAITEQLPERLSARINKLFQESRHEDQPEKPAKEHDEGLDREEKKILSLLSVDHPMHINKIAEKSFVRMSKLLASILSLEMKGLVEQLPGNHYIKKIRN